MLSRRDLLALSAASALPAWLDPHVARALADEDLTKVFGGDRKPTDYRLGPPKTLNDYFPFIVPKTKEAWEARRKKLREQLLVATGLWPMPEKTPLNPVVHGKIERDGYTIEKVFFASMPGHTVCGNLYRPKIAGVDVKLPGVLFAHGHWVNGRFHDAGEKTAAASVKAGGEPDVDRGRYFMQALPATLAKLGFVVFQYDMIGYADSTAVPHREGFRDAEAELRSQSFMGLQTWNSVRSLDFLSSLPDVDPRKIGMTGASGGGTQTFLLAAVDDRLASAFPAVMVSTAMQGGCVCENCSHLRVNTGNVEIAALFAPKPQAMSAANDWTKEMMTKGYPELQQLYGLYGTKERVLVKAWLEYGHQYNVHARQLMYSWFLKHLAGKDEEVKEPPFKPVVPVTDLSVFDETHPRPKDELDAAKLRAAISKASDEQIAKLVPKDAAGLAVFRNIVGAALRVMVHTELPKEIGVRVGPLESKVDGVTVHRAVLGRNGEKDAVPTCGVFGPKFAGEKVVVWLHPKGKASLFNGDKLVPAVKALTDAGFAVGAPDLLGTGENAFPKPFPVDRNYAGFTYGYNRSLLANRVHDALTLIVSGTSILQGKPIHLVGWGEMGVVAVLAKALAGDAVAKTAADLNQFRFEAIKDIADPMMLPGAVKYGGLPAFLALCAPGPVFVHNHRGTASGKLARAAYEAAGAPDNLTRATEKVDDAKIVEWLVK
jgi:dienelactone hydrolase/pimeloyl-ACP methyl ester carboxylesterase